MKQMNESPVGALVVHPELLSWEAKGDEVEKSWEIWMSKIHIENFKVMCLTDGRERIENYYPSSEKGRGKGKEQYL